MHHDFLGLLFFLPPPLRQSEPATVCGCYLVFKMQQNLSNLKFGAFFPLLLQCCIGQCILIISCHSQIGLFVDLNF